GGTIIADLPQMEVGTVLHGALLVSTPGIEWLDDSPCRRRFRHDPQASQSRTCRYNRIDLSPAWDLVAVSIDPVGMTNSPFR
ncbi:MAG: hypothetical protein MUF06_06395, partial [Pirellulaceae bacterium]|nr:hypothetical protein [Pirellulaceae bacterium]